MKILQGALKHIEAGRSIIPVNKMKIPVIEEWKPYQTSPADQKQLGEWFSKHKRLAVVAGMVSGNLELLDFDNKPGRDIGVIFQQWRDRLDEEAPGLFERLSVIKTPNKGFHAPYLCPETTIPGNHPLARYKNGKDGNGRDKVLTLIETRGEGGYYVAPPSPGYGVMQGDPYNLPDVSARERQIMIEAARSFNEYVEASRVVDGPRQPRPKGNGTSPGDDYSLRGDFPALLVKHGWQFVKSNGTYEYYRRPGKDRGHSASIIEGNSFYVFSSNAHPFEPFESYSPFAVYTLLEHGGDYSAAAKALAQQGYGEQKERTRQQKRKAKLRNRAGLKGRFSEVIRWLWRQHFARGMPHKLNAREGDGKTTVMLQAANEILEEHPTGIIIWIASEGFVQDTNNKMGTLGVDEDRFFLLEHSNGTYQFNFATRQDLKELDEAMAECQQAGTEVLAVFIDSIRGISPFDDNDSKIKNVMMAVNSIVCDKYGACLIYIDHDKKGQASTLLDKGVGTTAKGAAVRRVFSLVPVSTYVRKMCLAKSNILGESPPELMAALNNDRLVIYEAAGTADATLIGQAEHWLMGMFGKRETYKATDIYSEGEQLGFNSDVLKKAKKHLGIDSFNEGVGKPWYWTCTTFLEKGFRPSRQNGLFGD